MNIKADFLHELSRFSLIIRKKVTSNYSGARKSIAYGQGLTLKDHRNYVSGDDIRLLNWKMYGRLDKLYIKQFEEERTLSFRIIIDNSTSMDFGEKIKKFEYGSMIGLGFIYFALRDNDKFELSTFSNQLESVKPNRGVSQLASIIDRLNNVKLGGESKFEDNMLRYSKFIKSRSLIVVVSDFLFDLKEIENGLLRFGKDHELFVVQVLDREEKDLSLEGDVKLYDSESNTELRTFISRRLKEKYMQKLNNHSSAIHDICESVGATFRQVTTDDPIFDSFYNILKDKTHRIH